MRMQLDASKVDNPREARGVIDNDFFRSASRREGERCRSQPRGALPRRERTRSSFVSLVCFEK